MTFIPPLDLEIILRNTLAGNKEILTFLIVIAIGALGGRFRMPNVILLIMIVLLPIIVANYFANFFLVILAMMALAVSYFLVRWISR